MNAPTKTTAVAAPQALQPAIMDPQKFEHMIRVGKMMAVSPLFPDHLRKGGEHVAAANGALVMNMAYRLNEDPLTVAQNIYFVSGKPGWSASYMISKANQHGIFKDPIAWEYSGDGDSLKVTAYAHMKATGKRVEAEASMAMAKLEGWTKNAKYKSMPKQMLSYRSATALIRLFCPEVMVGVPAIIEVETGMKDVTPEFYNPQPKHVEPEPAEVPDAEVIDPDTGEVTKKPKAKQDAKAKSDPVPDRGAMERVADMIKSDLMDAPDPQDIRDHYANELTGMEIHAPDLHKEIMEWVRDEPEQAKQDHQAAFNHIIEDLSKGAPADATRTFFAKDLEAMKSGAPKMYAMIEEKLNAAS